MVVQGVPTANEIKEQLGKNWFKFLNDNSAKFSLRTLSGAILPSIFVGRYGYPKVKVGPMVPPLHGDTTILDTPEMWLGKSMEEIVNYRFSLVRGVSSIDIDIHSPCGKYVESLQELAMISRPVESEITFEKAPIADTEQEKEFGLDTTVAPFGPIAPFFKTSSLLSVDQRLEDVFYDKDLRSPEGIINLYRRGVEVSRIQRVLSIGMLGFQKKED